MKEYVKSIHKSIIRNWVTNVETCKKRSTFQPISAMGCGIIEKRAASATIMLVADAVDLENNFPKPSIGNLALTATDKIENSIFGSILLSSTRKTQNWYSIENLSTRAWQK